MALTFQEILDNPSQFKTVQEMREALEETEWATGMTLMQWTCETEEGREHQRKADEYRFGSPDPFMSSDCEKQHQK